MKKAGNLFSFIIVILLLIGEVKCVVKFFSCDFEKPYKAEIIYGISIVTGLGSIAGYCDFGK